MERARTWLHILAGIHQSVSGLADVQDAIAAIAVHPLHVPIDSQTEGKGDSGGRLARLLRQPDQRHVNQCEPSTRITHRKAAPFGRLSRHGTNVSQQQSDFRVQNGVFDHLRSTMTSSGQSNTSAVR